MKNKFILLTIIFSFLFISHQSFASTTNGTISSNYHYAWGENVGFIDFINIGVTDSSLSGSIYGENIGWIDLSTIKNNDEGTLSDYAWGENVGWVDFSQVVINTQGVFTGQAYGENIGFITFSTNDNNKVTTDWRPRSTRKIHSSSGSYTRNYQPQIKQPIINSNPSMTNNNTTPLLITKTLKLNTINSEVKLLQIYLNTHGYPLSLSGPGSPGHETNKFGSLTKKAIIRFQIANNLVPDGVVGKMTRSKMN